MCHQLVTFILSFLFLVSASAQNEVILSPYSFLKDSAEAPDYNTAFLVTAGDTLVTWQKQGNQTIVTYLNTKITKTVWADSVEVCRRIELMLNNFEEWCERKDNDGKKLVTTAKTKRDFYKKVFRNSGTYGFNKSYSEGLRYEEWKDKKGNSFTIRYTENEVANYTSINEEGRSFYDMKGGDTLSFEFSIRDSTYKENAKKKVYRYKRGNGWVHVSVFDKQRDSSFTIASKTTEYRKCDCDDKYVLYRGKYTLDSGEVGFRMNPECCTEPYVEVRYYYNPKEAVVGKDRVTYPFSKIEYLDENTEVIKQIQIKNKNGIPVKRTVEENNKVKTSRIKKSERKKYTIISLENLPIPNRPLVLHRSFVDSAFTKGDIKLSLRDTAYSLKNWTLKLDNATGWLDNDSSTFILITQKGVVNWLITSRLELNCSEAFKDSTELLESDIRTWLYFEGSNGKVLQKKADTVFRVQYIMRKEEYEVNRNR